MVLPPKASDRAQVESKEVRLLDSGLIPLDGQDVQIALKLSNDLHLNEIDYVRLLVSTNQEWGLQGLGPLDILCFTSGLWYTERRDLITALYTLLRAIVLDLRASPKANISYKGYLWVKMSVITFRNSIEKNQLVWVGPTPSAIFLTQEALLWKDGLLFVGKYSFLVTVLFYHYWLYVQIKFSLLVSLIIIISLISDALSASPDEMSILSRDASFRRDFHETVMAIGNDQIIEGCMHCVRLAWAVHLMILQDVTDASEINNDVRNINSCLEVVFSNNVFQFLIDKALRTPAYQVHFLLNVVFFFWNFKKRS
ncbi:hypothetical protein HanXRQr2_Chr15g0684151 [Helianthus annuus]|uniref:Uncharacterized protein n=1 Tax=Helianthus annuus TaxID=4232 RepID=A0A9K3E0I1_HELAN|nr:hypothetical protein HanXRQr2_Chr15g0684151 [Helianthus annuus]